MHLSVLVASLLIPSSFALSVTTLLASSKATSQVCLTSLSTVSPKTSASTKTVSSWRPALYTLVVTTSIPTVYTTPATVTSTSTITATSTVSTTASTVTDTYSTTTTFTNLITSLTTSTSTETDFTTLTTTSTFTSTVPTPSGFTYIDSSTGQSNAGSSKLKRNAIKNGVCPLQAASSQYPFAVKCVAYSQVHYTETIIFVGKTTTLVASTPTSTVSTTVTSTTTITIQPVDASTTTTLSTTLSSMTTQTISASTTTTITSSASASVTTTSYAACATNNILGPGLLSNGQYIIGGSQANNNAQAVLSNAYSTDYDCCVACSTNTGCILSAFSSPNMCYLYIDTVDTCNPGTLAATLDYDSSSDGFSFSNGPCGYIN